MSQILSDYPITHGSVRPIIHPRLRTMVNGQSVVRYLRFLRPVTVRRLELTAVHAGRWIPAVPTHPAHLTVSLFDPPSGEWKVLRDVNLPPDPVSGGEGLTQSMTVEEMDARLKTALGRVHTIDLGEVCTDLLRVECDREHPIWPNHGECNGGEFNVPFGLLNSLKAFGDAPAGELVPPPYLPPLRVGDVRPKAPSGMTVERRPDMVYFESRHLSLGFSLRRPFLKHLGWDALGGGLAGRNRLKVKQPHMSSGMVGGLSGPLLRTFQADFGPQSWTGQVQIDGNRVTYRRLHCGVGVHIDAIFTVEAERVQLALSQSAESPLPVLEALAWSLLWDVAAGMTGAAAVPTLREGRNGDVELPMMWAGDGVGCLRCSLREGEPATSRLQVESYRGTPAVQGGFVLGPRPDPDHCQTVPSPEIHSVWEWAADNFEPASRTRTRETREAIARHWASVYSCYRPEYGGFSNNAVSVNCHVNQHCPCELVAFTRRTVGKPDPLAMYRFTIGRALLDGGGYGYFRNLYLDSDPILLSAAGRIHQASPRREWLKEIEPGLLETVHRALGTLNEDGIAVCRDLTGNTGSFRWSSNAMDVVGFGHMDAYVNAWTYRGLRNAAALLAVLGNDSLARTSRDAALQLRAAFPQQFLNPETGWIAGWRSRDGQLHDAAYAWVNGPAIAFGLLDPDLARRAMQGLERLRQEVGAGAAHFGVPFNLRPIPPGDHMLPRIMTPLAPTFEHYTDGAMGACGATYYLRALQICGLRDAADQIARDLEEGYVRGYFNGGVGTGVEFYRWDGVPTGYEGTFVANFGALYPIAIARGIIQPFDPEWWPAEG